ncbi:MULTISPECIES: hypothetical protein [unclassified Streptomyces]|nr:MULTISPECIES: hypothetical protein [unclassified Streptomyces]
MGHYADIAGLKEFTPPRTRLRDRVTPDFSSVVGLPSRSPRHSCSTA